MRENRTYGSEGGETGATGLPYPYHHTPRARAPGKHNKNAAYDRYG